MDLWMKPSGQLSWPVGQVYWAYAGLTSCRSSFSHFSRSLDKMEKRGEKNKIKEKKMEMKI